MMNKTDDTAERILPQAIDTERAVLGAMLFDRDAIPKAIEILEVNSFYRDAHGKIFSAIVTLWERNEPADSVMIINELRSCGDLEAVGGASYLGELALEVATAAHVEYHARIIRDCAKHRKLIALADQSKQAAYKLPLGLDINGLIDETVEQLSLLRGLGELPNLGFNQSLSVDELMATEFERPTPLLGREGDPPLLTTHQILVIGATKGGGKTVSCLNIGMCLACGMRAFATWGPEKPVRVFYVHAEAERPYFVKEQLSKMLSDPSRVTEEQRKDIGANLQIAIGSELLSGDPLDVRKPTHQNILGRAARDFGAELLILDPLYWVSGGIDVEKAQDMQGIGKSLRTVVNLAECAVLTTSHFNKSGRIAGSYALEAFASTIIELHGLEGYGDFQRNDVGLYITKARNGWPRDGKDGWHVVLNPDMLWYDVTTKSLPTVDVLLAKVRGRPKQFEPEQVKEVLTTEGEMSYSNLAESVAKAIGCSIATAKRLVKEAVRRELIAVEKGVYRVVKLPF